MSTKRKLISRRFSSILDPLAVNTAFKGVLGPNTTYEMILTVRTLHFTHS